MNTDYLPFAVDTAKSAGSILMQYLRDGIQIQSKGGVDIVSDADLAAEQAIVEAIRSSFPDHQILAEEGYADQREAEHLWIVDPLDGTINFAHEIPHFAVSIAYYHRGEPVCGVIYNPARDDLYTAERGKGAFDNGKPAQVGQQESLAEVLIGVGFYYDRGAMMRDTLKSVETLFTRQIRGIRRFGTAALDLVQVGLGRYGAFFEYELSPWDFAAGRLFVEEAGGQITTCNGNSLPLDKTSVLASNGKLHQQVLDIVKR